MEAYVAVGIVAVPPMIVATALEIVGTWGRYVPDKVTYVISFSTLLRNHCEKSLRYHH